MSSIPHEQGGAPGEHPPEAAHAAGHGHHGHHNPNLHHHFETPLQQFESDKFGMWLFLATEILLFGGLFCAYAVYRANNPEVFHYAHRFLDWKLGGLNTLILIFSSFTMAWGVRAAQLGQTKLLAVLLAITIACGGGFMVVKYFEYSHKIHEGLTWGGTFSYDPAAHGHGAHGADGDEHGVAGYADHKADDQGAGDAHEDTPIAQPEVNDRTSAMPITDPAIGTSGDPPDLSLQQAEDAIPGVSSAASDAAAEASQEGHAAGGEQPDAAAVPAGSVAAVDPAVALQTPLSTVAAPGTRPAIVPMPETPDSLNIEPTKVMPAAAPPTELAGGPTMFEGVHDDQLPRNVQMFFSIYFAMTGLHGIHVLIGMIVLGLMLVLTLKGKFTAEYWTPIDLTGLYWHVVDLIWIFLFPLLYLIS